MNQAVEPQWVSNLGPGERAASMIGGGFLLGLAFGGGARWRLGIGLIGCEMIRRGLSGRSMLYDALAFCAESKLESSAGGLPEVDPVTDASEQSFPASDPPSWGR